MIVDIDVVYNTFGASETLVFFFFFWGTQQQTELTSCCYKDPKSGRAGISHARHWV
jgi:hypothetical protein